MKKLLFLFLCQLSVVVVMAQSLVSFGQHDSVYSDILHEQRPLWIYTPSADTTWFQRPAYPVMYVLDGDAFFATLQTMIQQLGVYEGNTVFPEMIIVGILNTPGNRMKNLLPAPGGIDFAAFMEKELIPYIDKKYATAPYRILIGHSVGGLFTTNMLFHHKDLFSAYVATDPSMFWNQAAIVKEAGQQLKQDFSGKTYFLAMAHTLNPSLDTVAVRKDTGFGSVHTTEIMNLYKAVKGNNENHLRWGFQYYPDDDHHSIPFIAIYDALRFIFPHNRFPTYLYTDDTIPVHRLKAMVTAHYDQVSADMGYTVKPPEHFLNEMGYRNLFEHRFDKAKLCFQMNVDYYPHSFNVYDSMGDYYKAVNEPEQAISCWKQALSLKENGDTRKKLEELIHPSH